MGVRARGGGVAQPRAQVGVGVGRAAPSTGWEGTWGHERCWRKGAWDGVHVWVTGEWGRGRSETWSREDGARPGARMGWARA